MSSETLPESRSIPTQLLDDIELLQDLARVQSLYGGHEAALYILQVAHYMAPEDHETCRLIARAHLKLGNPHLAVKFMSELRARDPSAFTEADWTVIARAFAQSGKTVEAKKMFSIIRSRRAENEAEAS